MKILHLTASDGNGGAARAAFRIHESLLNYGIDSEFLVQNKFTDRPGVTTPYKSGISKFYANLRVYIDRIVQKLQKTSNPAFYSFNFLPSGIHRQINISDADIVHFHWINRELISIKEVEKIKKPIVWTLHDMWAFSGAEHYDDLHNRGRYIEGYKSDNRPKSYYGLDLDRWTWKQKMTHWAGKDFNIVAPSQWLANCARESILFRDKNIQTIPYAMDLEHYKPKSKQHAQKALGLSQNDKVSYILFGAVSPVNDSRKGFKELQSALQELAKKHTNEQYKLLIFGSDGEKQIDFGFPTIYLGWLNDEHLIEAYSAADVMVVPSLQDNLPNTALEATVCGTPVVGFRIGGLPDIVDHKITGYLADPFEVEDLSNGIKWVLKNSSQKKLSEAARNKAEEKFDKERVAQQYETLYKRILNKRVAEYIN